MTNKTFFLLSEVAELLNVKPYVLSYALVAKKLQEPELVLGNRRMFSLKDIELAREYFRNTKKRDLNHE